jgi:hypothetical protein
MAIKKLETMELQCHDALESVIDSAIAAKMQFGCLLPSHSVFRIKKKLLVKIM